jgi:hypothetical protein
MIDIKTATTAELVAFYNDHAEKPVAKFADRKTAERRVAALIETLPTEAPYLAELGISECPCCGVHLSNGYTTNDAQRVEGLPLLNKHEYLCLGCGDEFGPLIKGRSENRAAGVAASWTNPDIAAKRAQRSAVEVDGEAFRSVRQAFAQLGLPMKEHINFRMLLKEHGQLNDYGRSWKIVPLNY